MFLSIYLPNGMYNIWYGGFASPARLMVPAVPALTIMLAGALAFGFRRTRWVYAVLAVPACLHAYLVMTLPSFSRYGDPATDHNFFIAAAERATNLNLTLIFPSLRHPSTTTLITLAAYVIVIAAVGSSSHASLKRCARPGLGARTNSWGPCGPQSSRRSGSRRAAVGFVVGCPWLVMDANDCRSALEANNSRR